MKKVITFGVYDLLHIGHIELFRKAKALGDYLIVAVQDSDEVTKFKPEANLVYDTMERCYMVSAIKWVDEVIIYKNVYDTIKNIDFDIFAKGPDQSHEYFVKAVDFCVMNQKEVITLPRTEGISTSFIKFKLSKNN